MGLVSADIDVVQERLHDSGVLWPRAELLRYYNDGYRDILAKSKAFRRITILDVPGRFAYSLSYDWEDRHANGTAWMSMLPTFNAQRSATYLWEVEHLDGITTPASSQDGITQQWERAHSGETDRHYRFALRRDHERVKRIAFDDALITPISVRQLDETDDGWMKQTGRLDWWTPGVGRSTEFEVYEIDTTYYQGYDLQEADHGIPRRFSGDRTYAIEVDNDYPINAYAYSNSGDSDGITNRSVAFLTGLGYLFTTQATDTNKTFCIQVWEKEQVEGETTFTTGATVNTYSWESPYGGTAYEFGVGLIRGISSPDRQYLPVTAGPGTYSFVGGIRDFKSSVNAITMNEVVVPDKDIAESDRPEMIPDRLQKYLRYYVYAVAFGREGEGQRQDLAFHCMARYARGIIILSRLADAAYLDRIYVKQPVSQREVRPPRVRFPSNFERVF